MGNCGNKRAQLTQKSATTVKSKMQPMNYSTIFFEYVGKTALTIVGSGTGRTYRFNHTGDIQSVDQKDINGMLAVPVLKPK